MGLGGDLEQVKTSRVLHLTGMGLSRLPRPVIRSVGLVRYVGIPWGCPSLDPICVAERNHGYVDVSPRYFVASCLHVVSLFVVARSSLPRKKVPW